MKTTSWSAIEKREVERIGRQEFDRRIAVARQKARQIADDPTWFAQDEDREGVFYFMCRRLESLAVQLTSLDKFEAMDHDTLGCAVCKMIEEGRMI